MRITYENGLYVARDAEAAHADLLRVGWRWLRGRGYFVTSRIDLAAACVSYADDETRARLEAYAADHHAAIKDSMALDADIEIPAPPGCAYRPYQKAGIAYAKDRECALIGDGMRLGKTVQAVGVLNTKKTLHSVLVVCPATLKYNWKREIEKWLVHDMEVGIAEGKTFPDTPVVVINYDLLVKHHKRLTAQTWDVAIFDECHALKNPTAKRTRAVFGHRKMPGIAANQRLFLSGTALFKAPIDLWPLCKACDPSGLGRDWYAFIRRYCDAKQTQYGLDTSGASNLEELQFKLRSSFMIRRSKNDVVDEIPPERHTIILPQAGLERLVTAEARAVEEHLGEFAHLLNGVLDPAVVDQIVNGYSHHDGIDRGDAPASAGSMLGDLARARRDLALAKVGMCVEHIKGLLEDEKKVVVFAHHRDVVLRLTEEFPNAAVVVGGMTAKAKDEKVVSFQNSETCNVFIGNILAAGQGINLSVANVACFVELSWVPSEMDQAEERIWDVLKKDMNWIYRYVVENSLDSRMVDVLDQRQKNIRRAMDAAAIRLTA